MNYLDQTREGVCHMSKWILTVMISCALMLSACTADTGEEIVRESVESAQTEEEPERLTAQVVVIGGAEDGLNAALSAVEDGAGTVMVLAGGETADNALMAQVEACTQITVLADATASALLMDSEGTMRAVNSVQGTETVGIDCTTVIVAVDPREEANTTLLSFLAKNENGGLLVDDEGCARRDVNLSQGAPTKCGVPLTTPETAEEEASGPVYVSVPGLYAVGIAVE